MSKILFLSLPIKSAMHISLTLAKSLRQRGHEVLFAGMADCQPLVQPSGFSCIPLFDEWFPRGFIQTWLGGNTGRTSWRDTLQSYLDQRRLMIDHERYVEHLIRGGHREFRKAIDDIAPDLILVDIDLHAYWALLAYQSGVRTMYYSPILPAVEDPVVPPFNSLLQPARDHASRREVARAWKRYFAERWVRNRLMQLAGIPDHIAHIRELARVCGYPLERLQTRTLLMPQLDVPIVIMCPEEFEFPQALGKPHVRYAEAAIDADRSEPEFPWERLEADKKLVFCSLGSVAFNQSFFQHAIDAAAREPGWQLVVNIGRTLSPNDFARVPSNTILVNGAPQLGLLRRAAAMINHGGVGSVKECIYYGVPQVVFPLGFDQPGAAARVTYHGLGVTGSLREVSADVIHALVSRVLHDEGFRSRSRRMSEAFQARERQQSSVAIVEHYLDGRVRSVSA